MKWQFEISDVPEHDSEFPIKAFCLMDNGVRRGPVFFKVEDLINALSHELDTHDADGDMVNAVSTPVLPYGTIRYTTDQTKTRHRVTMLIEKKMWDIRYFNDEQFYCIGFPRMIVQYHVVPIDKSKYRISDMRIYAVKDDKQPISEETPLFIFPYPNVGKENAIVCWGQNERLEINSLAELERAFRWFVSAPFNEDHGVRTTLGINRFKTLIEKIKDQPFNDEWLMPKKQNFGDLF